MVLASGTLVVDSDFRHFKEENGLLTEERVREHTAPSPFDYQRNCLLYLPQMLPIQANGDYYDDLAEQIAKLLDAANGHALGLFASYAAMSAVRERLKQWDLPYPVLTALPEVPVTHSLKNVERFIRAVKPEGYFLEGAA